jgi:hypothetical protein
MDDKMIKVTDNALNKVGQSVDIIVPVSLFNRTKKTVKRVLHKRQAFGMDLLYVHYDGLSLFVTEGKNETFVML